MVSTRQVYFRLKNLAASHNFSIQLTGTRIPISLSLGEDRITTGLSFLEEQPKFLYKSQRLSSYFIHCSGFDSH